jgi:hypothetical protein
MGNTGSYPNGEEGASLGKQQKSQGVCGESMGIGRLDRHSRNGSSRRMNEQDRGIEMEVRAPRRKKTKMTEGMTKVSALN